MGNDLGVRAEALQGQAIDYHRMADLAEIPASLALPVYAHIPFCSRHCWYCDFNVYERLGHLMSPYFTALRREVEGVAGVLPGKPRASSLYVGGGTPSLAGPRLLGELRRVVAETIGLNPDAEVTVEVNPSNAAPRVLEGLVQAGFNRISIGVQSLADVRLTNLDRLHSSRDAVQAIGDAKSAGFQSVNADLLYGVPGQSLEEWADGLAQVVAAGVEHLSAYALTLATERAARVARGLGGVATDDAMAPYYETAVEFLGRAGFGHYEVSNWARPGHECRYNLAVWNGGEYLAFGCGAHAYFAGRRYSLLKHPANYIEAVRLGRSTVDSEEILTPAQLLLEAIAFPLRTSQGVDCEAVHARHSFDLFREKRAEIDELAEFGLVQVQGSRLSLTDRGMFLADAIAARLTPDVPAAQGSGA